MKKLDHFHLIKALDSNSIDMQKAPIISALKKSVESDILSYESILFINGTGYQQTVQDEIEFVILSNKDHVVLSNKEEFIKAWKITKYKDYKLSELSGGWKKYLSLALFSNIKSDYKLYFDSLRQLSDVLIGNFIDSLVTNASSKEYYFFEYDLNIFPKRYQCNAVFWNSEELSFDTNLMADRTNDNLFESNFLFHEHQ